MKSILTIFFFVFATGMGFAEAKTVRYELELAPKKVNLSGKRDVDFALAINGGIPGPLLEFTEGDTAEITLVNHTSEEASVHWHGLLLPNEMDGVPYITTPPIFPGASFTYRIPLRQNGTYWYHSHTGLQEQRGVLGAIVIHSKQARGRFDREAVAVLSDWIDENPDQVLRNIKKDGGYYLLKKNSMPSWFGAIAEGKLGDYAGMEWSRMGAMDLSDIGYDAFLINGKRNSQLVSAKAGERIRIRIVNAGASSFFYISLAGLAFHVIAADGRDVEPVMVKQLLIGMAETYDIEFTVPENKNYELRATSQDILGFASAFIGQAEGKGIVPAPQLPKPDLYMSHSSHMQNTTAATPSHEHHHGMRMADSLEYSALRARASTAIKPGAPLVEVKLRLTGDMERYVWSINDAAIHEDQGITVKEGDIVRFVFQNETMMHHPMHLHGHFFRVLNGQGDYSPLKHTVDIAPYSTQTIEFLADEPGRWLLHCHNAYHMMTGMGRILQYEGVAAPNSVEHYQHGAGEHAKHANHDHDIFYYYGAADIFSNYDQLSLRASRMRYQIESHSEISKYKWRDFQSELSLRRFLSKNFSLFGGAEYFDRHVRGALGASYILPMLVEASARVNTRGRFRFDGAKKFQLTQRLYSQAEGTLRTNGEESEWRFSLLYSLDWHWALGIRYGTEGFGGGISARF